MEMAGNVDIFCIIDCLSKLVYVKISLMYEIRN